MQILSTASDDGVVQMTVSIADDDHKFEVWKEGNTAFVEYQETLSWRGVIRVSEPDDGIFKELMVSDEMTTLLDEWGVSNVRKAKTQ